MKAHINTTPAQPLALYYKIEDTNGLLAVLDEQKISFKEIKPEDLTQSIGYLCGENGKAAAQYDGSAPEKQMLIMYDFTNDRINALLDALRAAQIKIPLKAVATKTNKQWSMLALMAELEREKVAMEGKK